MNIVITGGAGFIGSNTAAYFLKNRANVVIFDNLVRRGTDKNLAWLKTLGGSFTFIKGDIRRVKESGKLVSFVKNADAVLHLAAQVAVTTSVLNPREDFEINALGTFNILEVMRTARSKAKFIYSSTNKVYGGMEDVTVVEKYNRYSYKSLPYGVSEEYPLDFHSPYGCSKGAAEWDPLESTCRHASLSIL